MAEARASGFRSVNLDLIYGLPKQTLDSFNRTLDEVLAARARPHRALQLRAPAEALQAAAAHRRGRAAVGRAEAAADDARHRTPDARGLPLHRHGPFRAARRRARAWRRRSASSRAASRATRRRPGDLLGLGVSAIGQIGPTYYQNVEGARALLRRARRRPAAGAARPRAHRGRPRAARGDPGADVPFPRFDRVDRARAPGRFQAVLRRRAAGRCAGSPTTAWSSSSPTGSW